METKVILQDAVDRLLFWALDEKRADIVKHATSVFLKGADSEMEMQGFNDWFVHDYRTKENKSIADLYIIEEKPSQEDQKIYQTLSNSVYSAFERIAVKDKMIVKDLFTKLDYLLDESIETSSVMLVRIYTIDNKHYLVEPPEFLPDEYKSMLVKGMLEKYNEYCRLYAPMQMEAFVKEYSLVLYRFLNIIDTTASEQAVDEEEFLVHQSTYVIKDTSKAHTSMKNNKNFILSLDDEAGAVFKLISGQHEEVIAELVLADDRLEIECTTRNALDYSKEIVEDLLDENAAHLKDEVLNIDDLIG